MKVIVLQWMKTINPSILQFDIVLILPELIGVIIYLNNKRRKFRKTLRFWRNF